MRVFYDHHVFSVQQHGGISRYFSELIRELMRIPGFVAVSGLQFSNNMCLLETGLFDAKQFFPGHSFPGKNRLLWLLNDAYTFKQRKTLHFELAHPTYYYPGSLRELGKVPLVITVHDMIHEHFPHFFPKSDRSSAWKRKLAAKADRIIAVSHTTKDDLVRIFDVDEQKIDVIYHGCNLSPEIVTQNESESAALPDKYLLYVGMRGAYKNFSRLVTSLPSIMHDNPDLQLVCAGGGKFTPLENARHEALGLAEKIKQYDLSDKQLVAAYQGALCHVIPSLYEGFGMTLLEAFACGCPVACSNTGSLPEVAKNAAIYFDPLSDIEIRTVVKRVIENKDTADSLRSSGLSRLNAFSWPKAAALTHDVYSKQI